MALSIHKCHGAFSRLRRKRRNWKRVLMWAMSGGSEGEWAKWSRVSL